MTQKTAEELPDESTSHGIALKFAEIFQNHYPRKPIIGMMEDLRRDIESYAASQTEQLREENASLQSRIKELEQQLETFERAERIDANSFEERCSEASHYAWLDDEYQAALERIKELEASQSKWVSVKERLPEIQEGESAEVLCLGFKRGRPDTETYEIMRWKKLDKPDLLDSNGNPIWYGWSNRWWNTNPDGYDIEYWQPLPSKPEN